MKDIRKIILQQTVERLSVYHRVLMPVQRCVPNVAMLSLPTNPLTNLLVRWTSPVILAAAEEFEEISGPIAPVFSHPTT